MITPNIELDFCSIAFRNEPLEQIIPRLAGIGYDGVELFFAHVEGRDNTALKSLRHLADHHGIRLPVFSPYFSFTRGPAEYDQTLKTAARAVEIAHILGATKIRTFTDVGPDGLASEQATPAHWQQAVRGLQAVTALDRGIEFVVETHERTLADTVETTRRLLDEVAAPNLKVNFQACEGFRRYGVDAAFVALAPWITHMHLQQVTPVHTDGWVENAGAIDFPEFIGHVKAASYRGSMSVEYTWQGVPWERAASAHRYLRSLLLCLEETSCIGLPQ